MTADTWYVVGLLANYDRNVKCFLNLYINSFPYFLRLGDENGTVALIYQFIQGTNNAGWTFGVVSEGNNKYLCIRHDGSNANNVKFSVNLEDSGIQVFNLFPWVPGQHPVNSSLLLSDFTNATPEIIRTLKATIDQIN